MRTVEFGESLQVTCVNIIGSVHPEMPDGTSEVSRSEMRDFAQDQGKQGLARRRTGVRRTRKPAV